MMFTKLILWWKLYSAKCLFYVARLKHIVQQLRNFGISYYDERQTFCESEASAVAAQL